VLNHRIGLGAQGDQVRPRLDDVRSETRQALQNYVRLRPAFAPRATARLAEARVRFTRERRRQGSGGRDANLHVDELGRSRQTALLDDAAALDERDPIAGDFYFTEQMGIEKHCGPVGAQFVDDAAHQQPRSTRASSETPRNP
jgi:hypothetical protein